jgi:hypothetical protein
MRFLGGAAAALLLIGLAAAPSYGASTRAEYIAQADPICAPRLARVTHLTNLSASAVNRERFKQAAQKWRRARSTFADGISQLAAITPPPADAAVVSAWLDSLRRQLPIANKVLSAMARGNRNAILRRLFQLADASSETQDMVRGFGFQSCDQY